MTRKVYNKIPLLGIYEDLNNVKNYYFPETSQRINSIAQSISFLFFFFAQSISNSNLLLSLFVMHQK